MLVTLIGYFGCRHNNCDGFVLTFNSLLKTVGSLAIIGLTAGLISACSSLLEGDGRSLQPLSASVKSRLSAMGSSPGQAMMVRIYKQDSQLEVWKRVADGSYKIFKIYDICTYSGDIGPKIREGDRQSPEGFYTISRGLMNPNSNYYLSFNLGFPNKFDRAHGRTGSHLMVHGDCSSRGCYAMTDEQIAEIYALARETLSGGNRSFQVQIYPFRMTPENLALHHDSPNLAYWQNLKTGYDHTEVTGRPPTWDVCGNEYVFNAQAQTGQAMDARAACPTLATNASIEERVDARQTAHQAAFELAVANVQGNEIRQAEDMARREAQTVLNAENEAARAVAVAEQSAAVDAAFSDVGDAFGGFFAGLFGNGQATPANQNVPSIFSSSPPDPSPTIDSNQVAPVPQNPPARYF